MVKGEQIRRVFTPHGEISYTLRKKRVKNLNLHLERDGRVVLSVPMGCPTEYADRFIEGKAEWILRGQQTMRAAAKVELPPLPRRGECVRLLQEALEQVYPLVEPLGVPYPELKVRKMKSQWGNCHWAQGYITLNLALARCPEHLRRYVALHELVHFLHHDHGPGFYGEMDRLMPRWREFRQALKGCTAALGEN